MHGEEHPLRNKTVLLKGSKDPTRGMVVEGAEFTVLDWWDHLTGWPWQEETRANFACLWYQERAIKTNLPLDNEVIYGHIYPPNNGVGLSHLVHASELGEEI